MQDHKKLWLLFNEILPDAKKWSDESKVVFDKVIERYREGHRRYHNLNHLDALTVELEKHHSCFGARRKAVIAALIFHDVVYECRPGSVDVEESAEYAREALSFISVESEIIDDAYLIILATDKHQSDDYVTQLFLDMDMSVLGRDPAEYDGYVDAVEFEFCVKLGISKDFFRQSRKQRFLEPALKKGGIFKTPEYRELEERALLNIRREMGRSP